jgi:molybdopterin-guanine dinucleotide biosynthesis protein A
MITGFVLAGGKSSRMGTDKSLMIWQGKTLVEHAIDTLRPLCSKIVISSNQKIYDFTGCETWPDDIDQQAPIIGIYSCLKRSETDINIVLSCDMPLISTDLLSYLLTNTDNYNAIIPVHDGNQIEPLCGIYNKSFIDEMQHFIEIQNYRLYKCIQSASHILVPINETLPFYQSNMFLNINTLADFNELNTLVQ